MEEYFKFKKVFDKYEDIRKQYLLDLDNLGISFPLKMDLYKSFYYYCQIYNHDILSLEEFFLLYDSVLYYETEDNIKNLFKDIEWKAL